MEGDGCISRSSALKMRLGSKYKSIFSNARKLEKGGGKGKGNKKSYEENKCDRKERVTWKWYVDGLVTCISKVHESEMENLI